MGEAAHALPVPAPLDEPLRRLLADEATGNMRHDVRNMLGALRNGAFYVRRRLEGHPAVCEADPRVDRFLEMIDTDAQRIGELMDSRLPPPSDVVPAASETAEVLAVVDELSWPEAARVEREVRAQCRIAGNVGELKVAVFCLLRNAVEALPAGAPGRVRVCASLAGEAAVALEVEDTGPGLPENTQALLEPFFTTRPGRLGLGLKVVRRVALRWGGRLELGPSGLGGAKASLVLPRRP